MARGQLEGSPGLGRLQPWTKLTSIYVGTHIVKIFLQVSYNWEAASATSASRKLSPVTSIWTPKNRAPGGKGLDITLKTNEVFVF